MSGTGLSAENDLLLGILLLNDIKTCRWGRRDMKLIYKMPIMSMHNYIMRGIYQNASIHPC